MKFDMRTSIRQKTTKNEFEIATAIFLLTTTTQTTAQATSGGVRGSHTRGSEGPHHHQQDLTFPYGESRLYWYECYWYLVKKTNHFKHSITI